MIENIKWCYCCELPVTDTVTYIDKELCLDCHDDVLSFSNTCNNCGGHNTETINIAGSSGKLYESKRCITCNQSELIGG